MEFLILGPFEVRVEGRLVAFDGARQRALLAVLLLHANRAISLDRLVEDVWGSRAPVTAPYVLQVYAAQLAEALSGNGAPRLEASAQGMVLHVAGEELDLLRFERFFRAGREALAEGDAERAAREMRAALDLWRGPPLADVEAPFAPAAIARLAGLHAFAIEERVEADLALGAHDRLLPELRALVGEHPQRERLRGQLMLALYRAGERDESLRAFEELQEATADRPVVEPAPALRDLQAAIARGDASLGVDAPGAADAPPAATERLVLAVCLGEDGLDGLVSCAQELCRGPSPAELVLVRSLPAQTPEGAPADLAAPTRLVDERRAALLAAGVAARTAAFRSPDRAAGSVRLASELDAELLLIDAPASLGAEGRVGAELAAILGAAPCDVAILVTRPGGESTIAGEGPVVALFGGSDHDWAALELAARVAAVRRAPLLLVGVASADGGGDASRLLASASLAIQRTFGISAEPLLVPRGPREPLAAAADAGFVAIGLSAHWRDDSVGPHRLELVRHARAPTVLVRRGLRPALLAPRESATRFTWSLSAPQRDPPRQVERRVADPAKTGTGPPERVLLTVLFTDIVGSTERAARLGDRGWRELLAAHRTLLYAEVARFGGRLVDTAGDGMFAVFDAPVRALRCAVAIRDASRDQQVEIRAGVHTGECEQDEDRVVGIAVHVGARVLGKAGAGEILGTTTVRDLVAGSGLAFASRGQHVLKGVPEPVTLFALQVAGGGDLGASDRPGEAGAGFGGREESGT